MLPGQTETHRTVALGSAALMTDVTAIVAATVAVASQPFQLFGLACAIVVKSEARLLAAHPAGPLSRSCSDPCQGIHSI